MAMCWCCGETFPDARKVLGYSLCILCGVEHAKEVGFMRRSMVQPINKSTPTLITDLDMLKQLNPKRTT
jgi:hypothetical protein